MEDDVPRHRNRVASDEEVRRFIRAHLGDSARKTVLLRSLREAGVACEQSRFARLYDEARRSS